MPNLPQDLAALVTPLPLLDGTVCYSIPAKIPKYPQNNNNSNNSINNGSSTNQPANPIIKTSSIMLRCELNKVCEFRGMPPYPAVNDAFPEYDMLNAMIMFNHLLVADAILRQHLQGTTAAAAPAQWPAPPLLYFADANETATMEDMQMRQQFVLLISDHLMPTLAPMFKRSIDHLYTGLCTILPSVSKLLQEAMQAAPGKTARFGDFYARHVTLFTRVINGVDALPVTKHTLLVTCLVIREALNQPLQLPADTKLSVCDVYMIAKNLLNYLSGLLDKAPPVPLMTKPPVIAIPHNQTTVMMLKRTCLMHAGIQISRNAIRSVDDLVVAKLIEFYLTVQSYYQNAVPSILSPQTCPFASVLKQFKLANGQYFYGLPNLEMLPIVPESKPMEKMFVHTLRMIMESGDVERRDEQLLAVFSHQLLFKEAFEARADCGADSVHLCVIVDFVRRLIGEPLLIDRRLSGAEIAYLAINLADWLNLRTMFVRSKRSLIKTLTLGVLSGHALENKMTRRLVVKRAMELAGRPMTEEEAERDHAQILLLAVMRAWVMARASGRIIPPPDIVLPGPTVPVEVVLNDSAVILMASPAPSVSSTFSSSSSSTTTTTTSQCRHLGCAGSKRSFDELAGSNDAKGNREDEVVQDDANKNVQSVAERPLADVIFDIVMRFNPDCFPIDRQILVGSQGHTMMTMALLILGFVKYSDFCDAITELNPHGDVAKSRECLSVYLGCDGTLPEGDLIQLALDNLNLKASSNNSEPA